MTRTLSAGLISHLDVSGKNVTHKLVNMLRLDLRDGTTLAFTDHDETLSFNLGDGSADYEPDTGILPSDLALSTGFAANDMEVSGPIGAVVTRTAVLGGRYDDAVVRFFQVNWSDLTQGAIKLVKGRVVLAEVQGGKFKFTVHSEVTKFAQQVGRVISGYCDATFGDGRCGLTPVTLSATVSAVTDARQFSVTFSGTKANDFFNKGKVTFSTGPLAGISIEVFDFAGGTGTGTVSTFLPLPEPPVVGNTLVLTQGCFDVATGTSKTRAACMAFSNIANFRGFPDVPGSDQVLRYPNPGG